MSTRSVVVLDYGSGNLRSAQRALERAGAHVAISDDIDVALAADGLVVPGVGAYAACMAGIRAVRGDVIIDRRLAGGRPVLGICVGMQVLFGRGVEHGLETEGLGEWPGVVEQLKADILPHMGWNTLDPRKPHVLLDGIPLGEQGLHAYFVHSYELKAAQQDMIVATTNYGGAVTAMVGHGNIAGTQFHPEKSQTLGLALIANFMRWTP